MIHSVLGQFLGFGNSDGLHIAYLASARWCQGFGLDIAHAGSFKSHKNAFLNDPKCQKWGFLDLGLMDWLNIAYNDRTLCFLTFGNTIRSRGIIQKCQKAFLNDPECPKWGFRQLSWVWSVGSSWCCISRVTSVE